MIKCDYCGTENEPVRTNCLDCGTSLLPPPPPQKSKGFAVILALTFGPLGLLYLGLDGLVALAFAGGVIFILSPFFLAAKLGTLVFVVGRLICAVWAAYEVDRRNGVVRPEDEARALLNAAARLEGNDRAAAISQYQEIIDLHPGTRASEEARRNIETLTVITQ